MIELGQHWEFVTAAYVGTVVVVAAMVGWTAWSSARAKARVAELEALRGRSREK